MKNEFCTYEQALALKELGFDEPCFGRYLSSLIPSNFTEYHLETEFGMNESPKDWINSNFLDKACSAPLKQQVLRFFREKYDYHIVITNTNGLGKSKGFGYEISIQNSNDIIAEYGSIYVPNEPWLNTYEEAESACIDKLIEILKAKK